MNKRSAIALLLLVLAVPAHGHDFWIEPATFTPAAGAPVSLRLKVGEHFEGEAVPRRPGRIERFFARSATGEFEVTDHVVIRDKGTTIVAYRSKPSRIELKAETFDKYLAEEGLEHLVPARGKAVTELFSRAAKTLLQSGGGAVKDRPVGLRLELVRHGDRFQVLFEGKPVQKALVVAIRRGAPASSVRLRSDAAGFVVFPPFTRGQWLVKTVHIVPSVEADWESIWASVTFAVP